jgi:hypothetical protein
MHSLRSISFLPLPLVVLVGCTATHQAVEPSVEEARYLPLMYIGSTGGRVLQVFDGGVVFESSHRPGNQAQLFRAVPDDVAGYYVIQTKNGNCLERSKHELVVSSCAPVDAQRFMIRPAPFVLQMPEEMRFWWYLIYSGSVCLRVEGGVPVFVQDCDSGEHSGRAYFQFGTTAGGQRITPPGEGAAPVHP